MEEAFEHFFAGQATWALSLEIIAILAVLGKAADWLVGEAVVLSERSGLPKVIIGATVVSLGTTAPEAAVSVLAAMQGQPDIALGNAVGSIICDTGLILGIACLILPLRLPMQIVNRQGWIQFGAGWLLVVCCWPWQEGGNPFMTGGAFPQWLGFVFLLLLGGYLVLSVRWAKASGVPPELTEFEDDAKASMGVVVSKLLLAVFLVVGASHVLIPAIIEAAQRMGIPNAIVAATFIAFGTSLPELVTAVTAARKDHGDLAIGNILGADILNVLFVVGMSAAVTPKGLEAPKEFFRFQLPGMLIILVVFRIGVTLSGERLRRPFGGILLAIYLAITILSYAMLGSPKL